MGILRRIQSVIRDHGIRGVPAKLVGAALDRIFEWRYGLETKTIEKLDGLTITEGNRETATYYEGSRIMPLRSLLAAMRQMDPSGALVDIGCGKGKVLLAAADCGLAKVRGIEFAHELCEIARANWRKYQTKSGSTCDVEIIEADAAAYRFRADETLFFLFNPFDAATLTAVLENLAASIREHRRQAFIAVAFLSEPYREAFAGHGQFTLVRDVDAWACRFSIFSNVASVRRSAASSAASEPITL